MVAQQLTPELTQPDVLVEIDPGPTMGPYQGTQRRVPMECIAESLSIAEDVSVAKSTFSPAVVSPAVEADGCPEDSLGYDATALIGMRSHGTKMKVLEGDSVGHFNSCLTFQQPSSTHRSKSGHTILDTGKEMTFTWMRLFMFMENHNKQGPKPFPSVETLTSIWTFPQGNRPLKSFKIAQAVVPSLPGKEKDWAKPISARGCPQRCLAQDWLSASRDPMPLLSPTGQVGAVSRDCALEDRHRSSNGDSNVDNELVICEKEMAGDDKSAVIGKSNAFQTEIPTRNFRTRRFETQSTGQENTDDVELLFSMSCPNGAKTDIDVDAGCIASEILMWMNQYNLVSYSTS